jgi:hypothetical protein
MPKSNMSKDISYDHEYARLHQRVRAEVSCLETRRSRFVDVQSVLKMLVQSVKKAIGESLRRQVSVVLNIDGYGCISYPEKEKSRHQRKRIYRLP